MMLPRAVFGAGRAILTGLVIAFGLVSAASQELTASEQALIKTQAGQNNMTALLPDHNTLNNGPAIANAPVNSAGLQASIGRGNPLWAIPLTSLNATKERPIFSPSRRSPAVAVLSTTQSPLPLANEQSRRPLLALVGVIAGDDDGIAIFIDETTKGVLRLRTGESHLGWTLQLVKGREVTLHSDSETIILALPNPSAK